MFFFFPTLGYLCPVGFFLFFAFSLPNLKQNWVCAASLMVIDGDGGVLQWIMYGLY